MLRSGKRLDYKTNDSRKRLPFVVLSVFRTTLLSLGQEEEQVTGQSRMTEGTEDQEKEGENREKSKRRNETRRNVPRTKGEW